MTFSPSSRQVAIFDALRDPTGPNIIVHAVAGSGKTTTIVEALRLLPRTPPGSFVQQSILFLAFNKSIADTLKTRCPSYVSCSTFHSLGLRALKRVLPKEDTAPKDFVDPSKAKKLVYSYCDRNDPDVQSILRLVSLTKSVAKLPESWTREELAAVAARFDMSFEEPSASLETVRRVAERSFRERKTIDFDDMLFLPVMLGAPFDKQEYLFVDEAQDTNDIQVEILARLSKDATRLCAVGDPHQAIYGFRGANSDSMDRIASRFGAVPFPLDICYRCSQSVVAEAQRILTHGF